MNAAPKELTLVLILFMLYYCIYRLTFNIYILILSLIVLYFMLHKLNDHQNDNDIIHDITSYDIIIIGSGPAGLTAGIYAARSQYKCAIIAGEIPLGQLMNTTEVENYPGFPDGIQGPDLMLKMKEQAIKFGATFAEINADHIKIDDIHKDQYKFMITASGQYMQCKSLIIATGAQARWLNIETEDAFKGKGISTCATCDGFFYRNKKVAVVGGGDTAVEEALYLSGITEHVYIIHRRDKMRASQAMQDKLYKKSNISFIWNAQVIECRGDNALQQVVLANTSSDHPNTTLCISHTNNSAESESCKDDDILQAITLNNASNKSHSILNIDGLFLGIGHDPQNYLVKDMLKTNDYGYVQTHNVQTEISGLFVAGDISDDQYRQAITASGKGCEAAMSAIKYLDHIS